jgi:cellulose biosynthesis protein BcsQ
VTVILAIANHNRGVGKTVTAANVSAGFARAGRRTLAVDCDPQADLTRWLLGRADQDAADLEAIVAGGADPTVAVHPTRVAGLEALPATGRLADITRALAADSILIARALGRLRPGYDAMLLDLPSSLGRLTVAALAAADGADGDHRHVYRDPEPPTSCCTACLPGLHWASRAKLAAWPGDLVDVLAALLLVLVMLASPEPQ